MKHNSYINIFTIVVAASAQIPASFQALEEATVVFAEHAEEEEGLRILGGCEDTRP